MNATNFFSSNTYLFLPTNRNPKVALAIDSSDLAKNSFRLYNPFSKKATYLKKISQFLSINLNAVARIIPFAKKYKKGEFVAYLESKLNTSLVVSVYYATAGDKVVLQLQSEGKIMGYIKFPMNKIGINHINNEIKAINILSEKNIVAPAILHDYNKNTPYLFLKELQGEIKDVPEDKVNVLLQRLKKQQKYLLIHHPRIIQLKEQLQKLNLLEELNALEKMSLTSKNEYFEVYEHGDFAPWNLIITNEHIIPFDFEYFEENGLEYMDLIKYYFQIGFLLKKMTIAQLVDFICQKIAIPEAMILLQVFLIKEITRKAEENESIAFEKRMLGYLNNEKA